MFFCYSLTHKPLFSLLKSAQGVEKLEYQAFDSNINSVTLLTKVDEDVSGPDSGTNSSELDSGTLTKVDEDVSGPDSGTNSSELDSGTKRRTK
jgi:hypothetical protein